MPCVPMTFCDHSPARPICWAARASSSLSLRQEDFLRARHGTLALVCIDPYMYGGSWEARLKSRHLRRGLLTRRGGASEV